MKQLRTKTQNVLIAKYIATKPTNPNDNESQAYIYIHKY